MIRQIPVGEKATVLASLAYIIALAFYKHWLRSQYDDMNGSLIERALGMKCDFTAIVVEGVGYVSDSETKTDIPLITKDILGKMLEAL